MKQMMSLIALMLLCLSFLACPPIDEAVTYSVSYNANGATGGSIPDAQIKEDGIVLTLSMNTGNLVRAGYSFAGWNTAGNGSGSDYAPGSVYSKNADLLLYAKWAVQLSYTVSYNSNGSTGGSLPPVQTKIQGQALILASNSGNLVRAGFSFAGWNTSAEGDGTAYAEGGAYELDESVILYARWTQGSSSVTYDGNFQTRGTAPEAQTKLQGVNLLLASNTGNLSKTGKVFSGWNTQANGGGTDYAEGATYAIDLPLLLYAKWNDPSEEGLLGYWPCDGLPEIPDNAAGTDYVRNRNFTLGDIEADAGASPPAGSSDWGFYQAGWDNTKIVVSSGMLKISPTNSTNITRHLIGCQSKTRRLRIMPSSNCTITFNNDGTSYFRALVGGEWNLIDVFFDSSGNNTFTDIENLPVGDTYIAMCYIGSGLYDTLLLDNSGKGNSATVYGATPATGISGNGLSFDGLNDYVQGSDASFPSGTSERTVNIWFKASDPGSGIRLLFAYGASSPGLSFLIYHSNGVFALDIYEFAPVAFPSSGYLDNTWHMLTVTIESATVAKMYLDGVLKATGNPGATFNTTLSYFSMGAWASGSVFQWSGYLDEPRIYSRALSANEIMAFY